MASSLRFAAIVLISAIACVGCSSSNSGGSFPPRQHYEEAGGFSYDPPEGWQKGQLPGMKFSIFRGEPEKDFAPNINVVDESFSGSLEQYVDANIETMSNLLTNYKMIKREPFQTLDGVAAARMVIENEMRGVMLRQTLYFLKGKDKMLVFTCTVLAEGGEAFDVLFEQSMKTLRLH